MGCVLWEKEKSRSNKNFGLSQWKKTVVDIDWEGKALEGAGLEAVAKEFNLGHVDEVPFRYASRHVM